MFLVLNIEELVATQSIGSVLLRVGWQYTFTAYLNQLKWKCRNRINLELKLASFACHLILFDRRLN
jgi:hypothetical protein